MKNLWTIDRALYRCTTLSDWFASLRRCDGLYVDLQIGFQATQEQAKLIVEQFTGEITLGEHAGRMAPIGPIHIQPEEEDHGVQD